MREKRTPLRSYYPVLLALVFGFAVTGYLSWLLLEEERQDLRNHFKLLVNPQVNSLRESAYRHLDVLHRLDDFFTASQEVTAEEFHRFNDHPLRMLPGIRSVFFAPRVPGGKVSEFRSEARGIFPGYTLRGADSQARNVRFPVYYQESLDDRWNLQGLDLQAVPGVREALTIARENREIVALFSHEIQRLSIPRRFVLVLAPLFAGEAGHSGYIGMFLDWTRLLKDGLRRGKPQLLRRFELHVMPPSGAEWTGRRFFYDTDRGNLTSAPLPDDRSSWENRIVDRQTIRLANRSLTLVFASTPFYHQQLEDRTSRLILVGGSVITVMIAVYLFMLKRAQRRIRAEARTDDLTGLYARRYWLEILEGEMERARRYGSVFSVIQLDLDRFKSVNDRYGHPSGDLVLETVGRLIRDEVRDPDFSCRYGGEEFAVLLPETRRNDAESVAERLRGRFASQTYNFGGDVVTVTASFGVAEYEPGENQEEFLKRVDEALYRAKDRGRNCVVTAPSPD